MQYICVDCLEMDKKSITRMDRAEAQNRFGVLHEWFSLSNRFGVLLALSDLLTVAVTCIKLLGGIFVGTSTNIGRVSPPPIPRRYSCTRPVHPFTNMPARGEKCGTGIIF